MKALHLKMIVQNKICIRAISIPMSVYCEIILHKNVKFQPA